ncbi:MAG: hypothetical protein LH645_10015, partial [Actinomycetia bacterium]|nr:hypothetical protein [Actinomycetes bacterium]
SGFVVALMAALLARDASCNAGVVCVFVTPLPGVAAAAAWAVVNRLETGRKWWAAVVVFCGSLAALIFLLQFGLYGLVAAMAAAGGFGVWARRLLDPVTGH